MGVMSACLLLILSLVKGVDGFLPSGVTTTGFLGTSFSKVPSPHPSQSGVQTLPHVARVEPIMSVEERPHTKQQMEGSQAIPQMDSELTKRLQEPMKEAVRTKIYSLFSGMRNDWMPVSSDEVISSPMEPFIPKRKEATNGASNSRVVTEIHLSTTTTATESMTPSEIIPPPAIRQQEKCPHTINSHIERIPERIPNAWLAVCHSSALPKKGLIKVVIDGTPICLFRTPNGEVRAISDVCVHRAAALSDGYLDDDMVVCPYHGYKFDGDGKLRYIPGVEESLLEKNSKKATRTVYYKTMEQAGLVYIFPDAMRAGAVEQHVKPFLLPEATDPTFRAIEGTAEIRAPANLVVENLLDMLHISYVHSFGNMQDPLPYSEKYELLYDDDAAQLMPYARTTFYYHSGPTSISKVVGKVDEVVVENEFHIPYTTVTRVSHSMHASRQAFHCSCPRYPPSSLH